MKEFKGTPAPWTVINGWDKEGNGKLFPSVIIHGDEQTHMRSLGRNSITINVSHNQQRESLMANAYLISAAPELLEACIELIKFTSEHKDHISRESLVKLTEKAINKALGL